jgi:predicted dehydrogenase
VDGLSPSEKRIGLGLIGCGSIARESHLPAIMRNPSLRLVAVADVDESLARATAQEFKAGHSYSDYRSLLEIDDIEAVDICVPTKYHAQMTVDAARSGKHVLCEKPIALTLEEADSMISACSDNKVKLMIAHSRRFIPRYAIVKRIIKSRRIGKPVWATQVSRRPLAEPGSWYFDPKMTYGPIAEVGIHEADLLRWFFEDEVLEVRGVARSYVPSAQIYDQVFSILKFRRGAVASFEVGYVLPKGFNQYTTLAVLGSRGLVSASDYDMNVVVKGDENGASYPLAYSDLLTFNSCYQDEITAFAWSLMRDEEPPVTGADARAALEIILAVLESIRQEKPVRLPLRGSS